MPTNLISRKNHLFVIGIDEYQNHHNLHNAVYDCERLIEILKNKYDFVLISDPIYNKNATRKNILEHLSSLSILMNEEDNLTIYYAGHGTINPFTQRGYWIPSDAENSESDYIPNSIIREKIEDINAKHIFLISDSCFSGTFLNQTRSSESKYKNHYIKLDSLKSRWYLASGRVEAVSDGKEGEGSPFANSLFSILTNNVEEYLSVQEIINYVSKATGSIVTQQPVGGVIKDTGDMLGQMVIINKVVKINNLLTDTDVKKLISTYSFCVGQKESVEKIKTLFPLLKKSAILSQLKWNTVFGASLTNITNKLKNISGPHWDTFNDGLKTLVNEHIDNNIITFDIATDFIHEIERRTEGNIQHPIIDVLIQNIPEIESNSFLEYFRGFKKKLSSQEIEKAKQLNFEIKVPISWALHEAQRPNVIWLLKSYKGDITVTFTVHLISKISGIDKEIIENIPAEKLADDIFNDDEIESFTYGNNPYNIKTKRIIIDGNYGVVLQYESQIERLSFTSNFHCRAYCIIYKDYLLNISCYIPKDTLLYSIDNYIIFLDSIMNSLIIMNKYNY
jgi:hypothetical protein